MSTVEKTPAYSALQLSIIREACAAGPNGKGNLEIAKAIAADPRMNNPETGAPRTYRNIVAKINREGIPYAVQGKVTKSGEPVTRKEDLVKRIAAIVSGNFDGLEKAPKPALAAIAAFVEAADAARVDDSDLPETLEA